jgi:hypothetical protein
MQYIHDVGGFVTVCCVTLLCSDFIKHILHLYYSKFPYKEWGEVPLESKCRPYIVTMQGPVLTCRMTLEASSAISVISFTPSSANRWHIFTALNRPSAS